MEIDLADVARALAATCAHGDNHAPRGHVAAVALLGSGYEADIVSFTLDEGGGPRRLVLRLYAAGSAPEKAVREFAVIRRLGAAGYPVPEVRIAGPTLGSIARQFLIMEHVDGVSLGPSYWGGGPDEKSKSRDIHFGLMARLHTLEPRDIMPDSPLAVAAGPYAAFDAEIARLTTLLARCPGAPACLSDAVQWLATRREMVPCPHPTIVHGDFHPNNVLVRPDGSACVIDWSNARLGDSRWDVAWMRLITRADAEPERGETELRLYEKLAARTVEGIAIFEAVAAAWLLLSVLLSLTHGAEREGMRAEAEESMRRESEFLFWVAGLLGRRTGRAMSGVEVAIRVLLVE
jgi:aminoglycoside phosphotransferase (APT) family kinase protein